MKIVLVYPPPVPLLTTYNANDIQVQGLGLLYLSAVLDRDHDVTIIGAGINPTPVEDIIEQIARVKPDVLGISTVFSTLIIGGKIIARETRKRFPDTIIIFGGNHATFIADRLAAEPYADIVVKGEGEVTFKELIERIDRKQSTADVRGIVYKNNGRIVCTDSRAYIRDIDAVPFPKWGEVYDKMPKGVPLCSSRGCPYSCIYCSTTSFWGRKWRARSVQNLVAEIRYIFDIFRPEKKELFVSFIDDNFTVDSNRVKEFCEIVNREDFSLKWGASSRIELMDDELLAAMAAGGCRNLFFGIESGSDRVLEKIKRDYTTREVEDRVERCLEFGILPTCSFMIGNPFEDREDIEKTFLLLKKLKSYRMQLHIFTPLIGTAVFNEAHKFGIEILTDEYESMNLEQKALINTRYLKAEEIEELYHRGTGLMLKRYREGKVLEKLARENRIRRGFDKPEQKLSKAS